MCLPHVAVVPCCLGEEADWMAILCGQKSRLLATSWTTPTSRGANGKAGLKSFV